MNVLVACDSFKGTLSAAEACDIVAVVLRQHDPAWRVATLPMADGGEGTGAALLAACGGERVHVHGVVGPLPSMRVTAEFEWLSGRSVAVVEMARASGLPLFSPTQRNPMLTTTHGTGQLLGAALERSPDRILLTLGGSATVDGGTGAARALGWRFLDATGDDIPLGGGGLAQLSRIVHPDATPTTPLHVQALCDVQNPLCGPDGAAAVYGPQKGATPGMVEELEAGLANLAECIRRDVGVAVDSLPGAGAAGGFGAGAVAFLGAELVPGVEAVAEACGLETALAGCDWVVTGEGQLDTQSLQGKVVSGVVKAAAAASVRVAVVCGRNTLAESSWRDAGVSAVIECAPPAMPDTDAFSRSHELLMAASGRVAAWLAQRST